jgi:glycosyltransferase involved in cell wall biosynthesis
MKICLVSQQYPPETAQGGIGSQAWNKARSLTRLGHVVHVISCAAAEHATITVIDGITVHRIRAPGREFPVYNPATYWLGYTWAVLGEINRLLEKIKFDVIDFPEYGAEGFAYQLDRVQWNWVPVVVQLHAPLAMLSKFIGWPEEGGEFYHVGSHMEGVSIRLADAVMSCSSVIADFTADFYGIPRNSIDVVHCGVDTEAFDRAEKHHRHPDARPTVLFVGSVAPNKGIRTVVESALRLRSTYAGIRLQVLGKGGDRLQQELLEYVGAHGAADNVEFLGFVGRDELPGYYRDADVFCMPSQFEGGTANVYLEAMSCRCPVVASTVGGAVEAVVDGESGFLVPPDDVDATTQALHRLLADSSLRQRIGDAGRRRVDEYFAMDKYILRIQAVYEKAILHAGERLRLTMGEP